VRVVSHAVPDNVGYFIIAAVVEFLQSVKYAPLNRFKPILESGNGPVEYDVRGVLEEPILIGSSQWGLFVSGIIGFGIRGGIPAIGILEVESLLSVLLLPCT